MTEWHTWDEVQDELADALGSSEERMQRVDQLRSRKIAEAMWVPKTPKLTRRKHRLRP